MKFQSRAASAAAFSFTAALMTIARTKVSFPILIFDRFYPGAGWVEISLLSAYAAWVVEKMLEPKGAALWRHRTWVLFSVVFFGQLLLGLAGFEKFLMTGKLHLPLPALILAGPIYRGSGLFMVILLSATLLLVGPAWCSHLCYIGAWDNLACRRSRHSRGASYRQAIRVAILAMTVLVAVGLRAFDAPLSLALGCAIVFGVVGVAVMMIYSRRMGIMVHCTAYCPIGAVTTFLGKLSPFRVRIEEGCVECGACSLACRYGALENQNVRNRRPSIACTLCGDCMDACKKQTIGYRFPGLRSKTARKLFIVLVVSLHAVFLGIGRI